MKDIRESIRLEEIETVWMSEGAGEEYGLRAFERVAMNRYLCNGYLAKYAPENRNPN